MTDETQEIIEIEPNATPQQSNLTLPEQAWDMITLSHVRFVRGMIWGIYTVNLAVWLWPDDIYNQSCGINGRETYRDFGIDIFAGTVITRTIGLPLLNKLFGIIAERCENKYPHDKTIEIIETTLMEASGIFVYIGGNPLLQQVIPSRFMSIIPAAMLSSIPMGNLFYKLFINKSYYRGALQDCRKQFPNPCIYIPLTLSEAIVKGAMMGSLALKLSESVINTVIDAMLINNLPQDLVNVILGGSMSIAAAAGALSILNPHALVALKSAVAAANVLFASYNFPLSVLECLYPNTLGTTVGYIGGGWTLALLSGAVGLSYFALPTAIITATADNRDIENSEPIPDQPIEDSPTHQETKNNRWSSYCGSFFRSTTPKITENSQLIVNKNIDQDIKIIVDANDDIDVHSCACAIQ